MGIPAAVPYIPGVLFPGHALAVDTDASGREACSRERKEMLLTRQNAPANPAFLEMDALQAMADKGADLSRFCIATRKGETVSG